MQHLWHLSRKLLQEPSLRGYLSATRPEFKKKSSAFLIHVLAPNEDYTNVFLSHTQLYFFAEKYNIQILRMLALENLQNVLAIFTLHKEQTRNIITLLRYVYANTNELHNGIKDLRSLLKQYVKYEMDTLILDKEFRNLMINGGGALLGDFMEMVLKRIKWVLPSPLKLEICTVLVLMAIKQPAIPTKKYPQIIRTHDLHFCYILLGFQIIVHRPYIT